MERLELSDLRREFSSAGLIESEMAADPFMQFSLWMRSVVDSGITDPNAMTLATVGVDGRPSARVVLLKDFSSEGFTFFTNYASKKGRDLEENPYAVLHFFWPQFDRQVIIYGKAVRSSREESEEYFLSRPVESRLGAWASKQSSIIESRAVLEDRFKEVSAKFGENVPFPDFWGGYRLIPDKFEFWQGRESRLHDRLVYSSNGPAWLLSRLSP